MKMRKVALDTETTGLFYYQGHRIIEIGCVEIIDNMITDNYFHSYINPNRMIDKEAKKITGLNEIFLKNKPLFKDIIDDFIKFIENSDEVIIHNAPFDINFINNELKIAEHKIKNLKNNFKIFDTLELARRLHPGKKNNLDALCVRYKISNEGRTLHGALLDATLLAKVYIAMKTHIMNNIDNLKDKKDINNTQIDISHPKKQEINKHKNYMKKIKEDSKII